MVSLQFAYPYVFYIFVPLFCGVLAFKLFVHKQPIYTFSLASTLAGSSASHFTWYRHLLFALRALTLAGLLLLIARPQWVDRSSLVHGEGRDIILTLDVSGSMRFFDDINDKRPRIEVAKKEAISFIEKRPEDPIGIVIFARDALSMCPLTLDKNMLKETVGQLRLGYISPDGTSLGTGLATAVNRLRRSESKSKIIIVLTDGVPTPETDRITPQEASEMAKEFGIKIYTVGIGSKNGAIGIDPLFGYQPVDVDIDETLLRSIADKTGGRYFRAHNPADMRAIYTAIDALERTEYTTNVYQRYYEAFSLFFWFILALFACELFLKLFLWRGV